MARGINKVILIGNLGADPETRAMPSGRRGELRIATSESWRDKQTGEQQERTEWHRVAFSGRWQEVAGEYPLRKGSRSTSREACARAKWQDKQGNDRYSTEIVGTSCRCSGAGAVGRPARGRRRGGSGGAGAGGVPVPGAGAPSESEESGGGPGAADDSTTTFRLEHPLRYA